LPSVRRNHKLPFSTAAVLVAGAISLSLLLSGCNRTPSPEVLATVNGKEIKAADLDRAYKQSLDPSAPPLSKEDAAMKKLQLLHGLIQEEILQQRATKLNLVATDEEVDAKITDLKTPYTQEEFDRKLKERNQTLDDLRHDIRKQLTQNKLVNKEIESKINITDAEIGAYYNAHKSDYDLIEPKYHLAEILVTNEPAKQAPNLQNSKAANDADAKKKIQMLRSRLDAGQEFGSVAAQFSEDPVSSPNNGDLGFVPETPLRTNYPDVFAAISKLKSGGTTDVLPVMRSGEGQKPKVVGYAIYQLIEKRPAGQRELNDPNVQQDIRQLLRNSHAQLLESAYFEMLYNDAKIHNYLAEQIYKNGVS
jgi:peptidyl-prolyl cis-trans isomerase SurA